MTSDDVQRQVNAGFRRSPLVPVVFGLADGTRVVVDTPEQLTCGTEAVTIRRKSENIIHRIDCEDIDRVRTLDELPGEPGGLSYAEFYETIRPLLWREPYEPFAIEMRDGSRLVIDRPGRLALAGRFGVFLPPGPVPFVRFTFDQVARFSTTD